MKSFNKKYYFLLTIVLILVFFGIYYSSTPKKSLPIFTPRDVNPELVDTTVQHIGYNHIIQDFEFTNQNGKKITQKDYENKIYVADFFFTTCPTICPKMTDNMVWLQEQIKNNPKVMLLSHSVTPDIDTPEVLKNYALEKGVIDSKWNLVTGDKKDIYYIARKSYLVVKTGKPEELYDMVHTENFVLVDQKRRIRGFYDGTNIEEVKKLLEDINFLSQE
ncbi:SCO family protein [Flavobacterium haoranii]|uniref:Protein SCO1/2 n=1 Tax=Flavobacterium haoranii TaxID=683124 RepID=A0A1M6F2Z9_9FLAO|nr:SCO family protein [Flavobacterium haoranii]SHI92053.1 protein SCO1/2 [Flavobacterium haoranii]